MLRLTRELKHQSISRREDSSEEDELRLGRRRSARLNPKEQEQEAIRDSGTESDEEELEEIAQKSLTANNNNMEAFLSGSPPVLSSSPPTTTDIDTESWDSFGHESGILTGDGDSSSDSDECATPRLRRRMRDGAFNTANLSKGKCEFPFINVCGTAEKRRHSSTESNDNGPIASRLRSNNDSSRELIMSARRAPVRLLINKPYWRNKGGNAGGHNESIQSTSSSSCEAPYPAAKRNRCNAWRPCLDLDKMIKNRIPNESPRCATGKKDHLTQDY
ncbi:hypothetical protein KIN20_014884 [Parelaphostrongylus tenuis]|uniref:Uncharacterized protein n=1 Tax=Parelaphostrongylus tenuis TaxID=148309 RepID=A0AAD5MIQ9_PARTN|nr:hypothetical protein KIN20_014884 [Parelaphostrongylus tenuis]